MEHELFRTNLEARVIEREGDQDFLLKHIPILLI